LIVVFREGFKLIQILRVNSKYKIH